MEIKWPEKKEIHEQMFKFDVARALSWNFAIDACIEAYQAALAERRSITEIVDENFHDILSKSRSATVNHKDEKYDDNWPKGSLEEFIWERCEADNKRVREIMERIGQSRSATVGEKEIGIQMRTAIGDLYVEPEHLFDEPKDGNWKYAQDCLKIIIVDKLIKEFPQLLAEGQKPELVPLDEEEVAKVLCPILFNLEWEETVGSTKFSCRRHAKAICKRFAPSVPSEAEIVACLVKLEIPDYIKKSHWAVFIEKAKKAIHAHLMKGQSCPSVPSVEEIDKIILDFCNGKVSALYDGHLRLAEKIHTHLTKETL